MKKFVIILPVFIIFVACSFNLNFKTNNTLMKKYPYTYKNKEFIIYYEINEAKDKKIVHLVFKNNLNYAMSNLKLKIFARNAPDKFYYVSRLKSSFIKEYQITVPKNTKYINIEYEYSLQKEDTFLNPNSSNYSAESDYVYKNKIELLIK